MPSVQTETALARPRQSLSPRSVIAAVLATVAILLMAYIAVASVEAFLASPSEQEPQSIPLSAVLSAH